MACGDPTYFSCGNGTMPADFCCSQSSYCVPLAANTTLLCCPQNQICAMIAPIDCNISLQNSTAQPESSLRTTNLSGSLPTCGSSCCPFGYTCTGGNVCVMDADQSNSVPNTVSTSKSSSTALAPSQINNAQSTSSTSTSQTATSASLKTVFSTSLRSTVTTPPLSSTASTNSFASTEPTSKTVASNSTSSIILGLSITIGLFICILIVGCTFTRWRRKRRLAVIKEARERFRRRAANSESIRLQSIEDEFPIPPGLWNVSGDGIRRKPVPARFSSKPKAWDAAVDFEVFELPATPVPTRKSFGYLWSSPNRTSRLGGNM